MDTFNCIAVQAGRGELTVQTNIDAAARLVQVEALLAARTVAIANSVACNRFGNDVPNVCAAVQRIGFRTLNALAAAVIVRQLDSQITEALLRGKAGQLWKHSANVAALSQGIARRVTQVDPETAMFAGIVHEVNGFYLLSRAAGFPGLLDGEPEEWIEFGEIAIGRGVLAKPGVPAPVTPAIEAMWGSMRAASILAESSDEVSSITAALC